METKNLPSEAQQKSWTDNLGETPSNLKDKAEDMADKVGHDASDLWQATEAKAGELLDKIKSGEITEETKEKLNEIANEAKSLWNKIVDKFDSNSEEKA